MSGLREFVCYSCGKSWQGEYTFWHAYLSPCSLCGTQCQAVCDTEVFADQNEWKGFYDAPLFDFDGEHPEKTEADLEAERDTIRDEIAEALGAAGADVSDVDDADADADSDVAGGSDGF